MGFRAFRRITAAAVLVGALLVPAASSAEGAACTEKLWAGPSTNLAGSFACTGLAEPFEELTVLTISASATGLAKATMSYKGFAMGTLECRIDQVTSEQGSCSATRVIGPNTSGTGFSCSASGLGIGTFSCSVTPGGTPPQADVATFTPTYAGALTAHECFDTTPASVICETHASAATDGALNGSFTIQAPGEQEAFAAAFGYSDVNAPYTLSRSVYTIDITVDMHLAHAYSNRTAKTDFIFGETIVVGRLGLAGCFDCVIALASHTLTSFGDDGSERSNEDLVVRLSLRKNDGSAFEPGEYWLSAGLNAYGQLDIFDGGPATTMTGGFDALVNSFSVS